MACHSYPMGDLKALLLKLFDSLIANSYWGSYLTALVSQDRKSWWILHDNIFCINCLVSLDFFFLYSTLFWENIRNLHIISIHHMSNLWRLTDKEDKNNWIFQIQYLCCWWPGDTRSQGISNHSIDLVVLDNSKFGTRRLKNMCQQSGSSCKIVQLEN